MGLLTTWALIETGIHLVMTNTSLGDKIGYNEPKHSEGSEDSSADGHGNGADNDSNDEAERDQ